MKRKNQSQLKPGDEGYMTPTQLRNARKRRAKQQKQQKGSEGSSTGDGKRNSNKIYQDDPSLKYASNPRKAPIVRRAVQFFRDQVQHPFSVYQPTSLHGWRTVAKLAVRNVNGQLSIGLFAPGSHELVEVPECKAHHPSINKAVAVLQAAARELKIPAFDEKTGDGCIRHVALSVERLTRKVQLTLVWNDSKSSEQNSTDDTKQLKLLDKLCKRLIKMGGDATKQSDNSTQSSSSGKTTFQLHSLYIHFNPSWKHANAIFDYENGRWEQRYGPDCGTVEYLSQAVSNSTGQDSSDASPTGKKRRLSKSDGKDGGHRPDPKLPKSIPLYFPPTVFRQANLDAFTEIVVAIRTFLCEWKATRTSQPRCLELYGGVGTIGLYVADLFASLVSSDENPHNVVSFNKSKEALPKSFVASPTSMLQYESKSATAMVDSDHPALESADVIIVDPPRKGLEPVVSKRLRSNDVNASCLIYVSCGFDAFCRDYDVLTGSSSTSSGKPWKLVHAAGYILFPGSDAIETLAIFTR